MLADVKALLGGTFDPPHWGHLAMANAAIEQLDVDEVLLMPAGEPWQKADTEVTGARHRLAMTRLAAVEDPRFVVSDAEIMRSGPTYTIDTVETMDEPCVLVLGSDAAVGITTWHRAEDLLARVALAVVERDGVTVDEVAQRIGTEVQRLAMPLVDLSSTAIREYVAGGHSARFLVPDAVADYIDGNSLYR